MSVAAGKPWWQVTKTPRQGFLLGGMWTLLGLGQLLFGLSGGGHVVSLVIGALWLVLAVGYLASAAALFRRERSRTASGTSGDHGLPPSS
jgi:hypothetical protein